MAGEHEGASCPVCGGRSECISDLIEGYVAEYEFVVYACTACRTHFSSRRDVPDWLYDRIYSQAGTVPGYSRYARYARVSRRLRDPLAFLAKREAVYWYVQQELKRFGPDARIVELGCGQGYLTHAMRRAGYKAIGVDVSQFVISQAQQRYGHPEWFCTVDEFADRHVAADLVVALELIEHVPDPVAFLRDAFDLVGSAGEVLITTPNKDSVHPATIWNSDLPPVHLYWLGVDSLESMAEGTNSTVKILSRRTSKPSSEAATIGQVTQPILDAKGQRINRSNPFTFLLRSAVTGRFSAFVRAKVDPTPTYAIPKPETQPYFVDGTLAAVFRPRV